MVYGNPVNEEIQLNEETISAGAPYKNYNPETKNYLSEIRQLIFEGKYPEAQTLAGERLLSKNGFGMPYQTAGSLRLRFQDQEGYTNFRRELDLEKPSHQPLIQWMASTTNVKYSLHLQIN